MYELPPFIPEGPPDQVMELDSESDDEMEFRIQPTTADTAVSGKVSTEDNRNNADQAFYDLPSLMFVPITEELEHYILPATAAGDELALPDAGQRQVKSLIDTLFQLFHRKLQVYIAGLPSVHNKQVVTTNWRKCWATWRAQVLHIVDIGEDDVPQPPEETESTPAP